jgi:hypothetical protein
MKCILKVKELLDKLKDFEYVLIKTQAPYMPDNFPKSYPVGKDLDVMVREDDIQTLRDMLEEFSEDYADDFDIYCIDEKYGFRVRFQEGKKLHFQFDIKSMSDSLSQNFVTEMIDKREWIDEGYYIAPDEYELIIRISNHAPHKQHHAEYIHSKIAYLDSALVPDKLKTKTIDILKDMIT